MQLRRINKSLWSEHVAHLYSWTLYLAQATPTSLWIYKLFIRALQSATKGVPAQLYKLLVKLNLYGSAGIFWQIVYKLWPQRAYTQKLFISFFLLYSFFEGENGFIFPRLPGYQLSHMLSQTQCYPLLCYCWK